ncbi:MAG: DNA polymerase III subunit delta [Desulfovibrionaceae bacterium]|nr:DNA polymerase III subunit delta [Desulfovibrionaceae bacterium]
MSRPGFLFCISPDSTLLKQHVELLAARFPPPGGAALMPPALSSSSQGWNRKVFWGDSGLEDEFWDCLGVQNLFGGGTLVVLRNAQALPADTWKKLSKAMAQANPAVWPVLCLEVEFERGKPKIPAHITRLKAFDFAGKQGWVWQSPGLDARGLQSYIQAQSKKLGLDIPPALLSQLAAALPSNAAAVQLELEKLALLVQTEGENNQLKPEHLSLIRQQAEVDIYRVLRALQNNRNSAEVWAMAMASESGSSNDKMLFGFLGALVREARILWQILFSENVYIPAGALAEKQALAQKLGVRRLAELWELALEAEQGVKSGEVSEDQALERLLADLSLLFSR